MYTSQDSYTLWNELNTSSVWQDILFYLLASLYGIVAVVALVQLIMIKLRLPEHGWTFQMIFHLCMFLVNAARGVICIYLNDIQHLTPEVITQHIVLDLPSLGYFSTYALLVLFWSQIYNQAKSEPTDSLTKAYYAINAAVYTIQIALWLIMWWKPIYMLVIISKVFLAGVYLLEALGFLIYGGRLFLLLKRFPVESKSRRKKLHEVGWAGAMSFVCFLVRCIVMCFNAFNKASNQDVSENHVLNFIYYFLVEILLSCVVLFTLRKLPPKKELPSNMSSRFQNLLNKGPLA